MRDGCTAISAGMGGVVAVSALAPLYKCARYCEQFSSSLAVMARSLGIPARVSMGYVSGEYNPFTGLYEVRANDAHAGVEVYFPGYGWSTFDPTPSFDSNPWQYEAQSNVQGGKVFGFLAEKTGRSPGSGFRCRGNPHARRGPSRPGEHHRCRASNQRNILTRGLLAKVPRKSSPRACRAAISQGLRCPALQPVSAGSSVAGRGRCS